MLGAVHKIIQYGARDKSVCLSKSLGFIAKEMKRGRQN
jgi:hypothetical protein